MPSGGVRINAGRPKIGSLVQTRLNEKVIDMIDSEIDGNNRADKVRNCLLIGLQFRNENKKSYKVNQKTFNNFYNDYTGLMKLIGLDNNPHNVLCQYLYCFFNNSVFSPALHLVDDEINDMIISKLKKYEWSYDEYNNNINVINPLLVGSMLEKIVNQKTTGAYYTPKDTSRYITQYAIVFSLLTKLDSPEIAYDFYSKFDTRCNEGVLNANRDPVEILASSINNIDDKSKNFIFSQILDFTVVDPTCGTGSFVIEAAEIMMELYHLTDMNEFITNDDYIVNLFNKCLYGMDIMESAITMIKLRSALYVTQNSNDNNVLSKISFNFICSDSLGEYKTDKNKKSVWEHYFPDIMISGGFDCVIGNPPYIENSKLEINLSQTNEYQTYSCGNLYACIVEKSYEILKSNMYMGLIVPISIVSTARMAPLRKLMIGNSTNLYFANFSDRPSCLFSGVHQKLTIFFAKKKSNDKPCRVFSSSYLHWNKEERNELFSKVKYYELDERYIDKNGIAKIGDKTKQDILENVSGYSSDFSDLLYSGNSNNNIYLNQRMTFWTKCFTEPEKSKEYKAYNIKNDISRHAVAALLNSSLFYLLWETYSDCWHITYKDLIRLKIPEKFYNIDVQNNLKKLEINLEHELYQTREYVYTKQTDYIYMHKKCLKAINELDDYIARLYGFTDFERLYIDNYNLKYRINNGRKDRDECN